MCPYQFYKEEEKYYPRLYCKLKENTMNPYCVYSKRCDKAHKYILLDNSDNCNIMEEAKKLNIPSAIVINKPEIVLNILSNL